MTHHVARLTVVALVAPVLIALTGFVLELLWLPRLPSSVTVHWSLRGADGTAPAWTVLVATIAAGLVVPALVGIPAVVGARRRGVTWVVRLLGALSPAVVTMVVGAALAIDLQAGAAGTSGASLGAQVALTAVLAALVGLLAWFVLPRHARPGRSDEEPAALDLGVGERAVWTGSARPTPAVSAVVGSLVLLVLAVTGVGVLLSDGRAWPLLIVPVVLIVFLPATLSWRVRIDDHGLVARSLLGWPVFRVAADDIETAATREVSPIGDFGGWGVRFGPSHALGIITRAGEALVLRRRADRELVITVDDAETAAALLGAVYARARERG